ncbi:DUF3303 domain-containing protein [Geodermatophilus sp. SYSU D01176]
MRYVVTWRERPTGSVADRHTAQERVLESMGVLPRSLTFHVFVGSVGRGGYAVVDTDEPADLEQLAAAYGPHSVVVEQVVEGTDAVAARTRDSGWCRAGRDLRAW